MPRHLVIHTHTTNAWETTQGLCGSGRQRSLTPELLCQDSVSCQFGQELLIAVVSSSQAGLMHPNLFIVPLPLLLYDALFFNRLDLLPPLNGLYLYNSRYTLKDLLYSDNESHSVLVQLYSCQYRFNGQPCILKRYVKQLGLHSRISLPIAMKNKTAAYQFFLPR